MHQKAKLLTNLIMERFFIVIMMQFGVRDQNCSQRFGPFFTPDPGILG